MWSVAMFAETHTVEYGESLRSIAAKYKVTETDLIEANPGADKVFYVGLTLNIPKPAQTFVVPAPTRIGQKSVQTTPADTTAPDKSPENKSIAENEAKEDKAGPELTMMIEYGFLPKVSGVRGTNYTYAFTIGANYYFMHSKSGVFAGGRIGYNSANYNGLISDGRGSYLTTTTTAHFITLPLHGGYTFANAKRNCALTPYAGLGFNFCVGGKSKMKAYSHGSSGELETDINKKVGVDARIGLQLRLWGFNVGASYVIPLNDNQKGYFGSDCYMAINIGFGF